MDDKDKIFKAIQEKVENEPYAKKLGLKLIKLEPGYSVVEMVFSKDMENIFGLAHGGAIFSLIDEAFETASNSHGTISLALNMNITYHNTPSEGSILRAEAKEINKSHRIGTYNIEVTSDSNGNNLIATCQALVYRKKDKLPFLE